MANQLSAVAGGIASQAGGATGTPLGSITGVLQGSINNLFSTGQGILDKWFPPAKREELKNKMMKFATERPQMAAFLLSQIALSGIPLALFIIMSITVLIFALLVGIIVGVLGAVLFTVFCLGLALFVLLPTLFMTTFAATFVFLWGLGAYYILKWFNQKDIPGIHKGGKDAMQKEMGLDNLPAINGNHAAPRPAAQEKQNTKHPNSGGGDDDGDDDNGHAPAAQKGQKPAKSKSPPATKRSQTPSAGKGTGADHGGPVGDVKKTAGGAVSGVTSGIGL
jgi:Promethin